MNVFEDLIEELKEENLLEETVIEAKNSNSSLRIEDRQPGPNSLPISINQQVTTALPENYFPFDTNPTAEVSAGEVIYSAQEIQADSFPLTEESAEIVEPTVVAQPQEILQTQPIVQNITDTQQSFQIQSPNKLSFQASESAAGQTFQPPKLPRKPLINEKEFFKRRAIDEVAGLQMVEHVLSGVEREQMKIAPKPFDDIPVKKALHDFMQVTENNASGDHARSEFQLMQETESWYSSLSHRDKHISVAHLRRFCETTKPALSPQALIALGRFYRNSPYSEQIRNKFDLVMTRLFSHEIEDEKRELLFPRDELAFQIKELYGDWASIQVYNENEDDSELLIAVLKFQDFVSEAERTDNFDELVNNDFFNRLRMFKESCNENFFAPPIIVAAVEANVKIGNRYVDLIQKERNSSNAALLEENYGFLHDQAISDSTGKTFQLVELLKEKAAQTGRNDDDLVEIKVNTDQPFTPKKVKKPRSRIFAVNKWLLALTVLVVLGCGGLYFWAEMKEQETSGAQSSKVKKVNLENSSLKEFLQAARINEDTFYGVISKGWDDLSLEKKEEALKKIMTIGLEKGFKKVQLLNEKGRTVGYGTAEKVEVLTPTNE